MCCWSVGLSIACLAISADIASGYSVVDGMRAAAAGASSLGVSCSSLLQVATIPSWKLGENHQEQLVNEQLQTDQTTIGSLEYGPLTGNVMGYPGQFNPGTYSEISDHITPPGGKRSRHHEAITSTSGQDLQRCPIIQLPPVVFALPKEEGWAGMALTSLSREKGIWMSESGAALATWEEHLMSTLWQTIHINSLDGRLALKAVPRTEGQLLEMYGWKADKAADKESKTFLIADCDDEIMFVLRLQLGLPDSMEVYDRLGGLAVRSLTKLNVAHHQFVGPGGSLLATAESPGLSMNVTRPPPPDKGERGVIQPYAVRFEDGGYPNASRILDQDYRWVLLLALQARAVVNAQAGWAPIWPTVRASVWWIAWWTFSVVLLLACVFLLRLVYPEITPRNVRYIVTGDVKRGLRLAYT